MITESCILQKKKKKKDEFVNFPKDYLLTFYLNSYQSSFKVEIFLILGMMSDFFIVSWLFELLCFETLDLI